MKPFRRGGLSEERHEIWDRWSRWRDSLRQQIVLIDSHQHFWHWSKGWFSRPEPVFSRNYLPADLAPLLLAQGIDKTIVVQTAAMTAETDFLLELANTADFIGGVVGWLDLESPEFPRTLEHYCRNRYFVGVRPMLESLPEDEWLLRTRVLEALSLIAQAGVAFEFLTFTRHLPFVLKVLDKVENLRAVLDHLSKPEIKSGKLQPWSDLMREIALHTNVYCKLSGMVTEADHHHWTIDQLLPYAEHVMKEFRAERVMFGSDWPVCLLAATYEQAYSVARSLVVRSLGEGAIQAVFGDNAARFYQLD
jgi:L-fuconolactonase